MAYKDLLVQIDDTKACEVAYRCGPRLGRPLRCSRDRSSTWCRRSSCRLLQRDMAAPIFMAKYKHRRKEGPRLPSIGFGKQQKPRMSSSTRGLDQGPIANFPALFSGHSRYGDLSITGQTNHEDSVPSTPEPQDVVMTSGAPVLITPFIGAPAGFGGRVMVAWNASREAARAVRDAMPLLEQSQSVDLVIFRPKSSPGSAWRTAWR